MTPKTPPTETFHYDDGEVYIDFEIEPYPGGDYVVLIECGEATYSPSAAFPEGAPRVVHAVYNDVDAALNWVFARAEEAHDREELMDIFEDSQTEYDLRVAAGWGSWVRGDMLVNRSGQTD